MKFFFAISFLFLASATQAFIPPARVLFGTQMKTTWNETPLFAVPWIRLASADAITNALENKKTVLLDVRSPAEINLTGKAKTRSGQKWLNVEPSKLSNATKDLIDKSAPIVVYCASGMRASKAKAILERQGFKTVLNAGGLTDLQKYIK